MRIRITGLAMIGLLGFAACHNIFNKDKSRSRSGAAIVPQEDKAAEPVGTANRAPEADDRAPLGLKYIYLTFDDGPEAGTMNCYQVCKSNGVKATFFLVGEHAWLKRGKKILDTMRGDMRHFLFANHSYTHAGRNHYEAFYGNPENAMNDFLRLQDSMKFSSTIVRFPGNNVWALPDISRSTRLTRPLARLMDSAGYEVLGWDLEWHYDRKSRPVQTAETMAAEVIAMAETGRPAIKDHVVVLAHDRMFREDNYRDSLKKMIAILQSRKGYIFETADRYPQLRKNTASMAVSDKIH